MCAGIKSKYNLNKSFLEFLYRTDNWINEGFGWIIESLNGEYIDISIYSQLSGTAYIKFATNLRISMKGLINIRK